jgi:hypothetical protein
MGRHTPEIWMVLLIDGVRCRQLCSAAARLRLGLAALCKKRRTRRTTAHFSIEALYNFWPFNWKVRRGAPCAVAHPAFAHHLIPCQSFGWRRQPNRSKAAEIRRWSAVLIRGVSIRRPP